MKRLLFLCAVLVSDLSFAQQFTLDWFTMDGGGGTSAGGT